MQLARKIVLALGVLAVFVIVGLEAVGVVRELRATTADMEHDHRLLGETLSAAVARAWVAEGPNAALDLLRVVNSTQHEVSVRFVWLDSVGPEFPRVTLTADQQKALVADRWLSFEVPRPGPDLRISYEPVVANGRLGALEITQSTYLQHSALVHSVLASLIASALLGALFLLTSGLLGDRLVGRPIEQLVSLSRRLGEGDLDARVELRTRDELETLAKAMGEMAGDLGKARARAEREMNARLEMLERLRHADRLATVGKLAAGVAHELGTPMNVVSARAKMVATGEVEGEEIKDSARIIGQQVQSMTTIIRQLLDFARRRKVQRSQEDVAHLVAQVVRMLTPLAARRRVNLDTEGVKPITCELDAGQIHQVLTNLVMNAIQAMDKPGTVALSTSLVDEKPPGATDGTARYLRIDVRDEGMGIPEDLRPHIFEPFVTTKDVGEGTGLGLSVSWGIVQDHSGFIQVQSEPGQGSTFSVFLPAGGE